MNAEGKGPEIGPPTKEISNHEIVKFIRREKKENNKRITKLFDNKEIPPMKKSLLESIKEKAEEIETLLQILPASIRETI